MRGPNPSAAALIRHSACVHTWWRLLELARCWRAVPGVLVVAHGQRPTGAPAAGAAAALQLARWRAAAAKQRRRGQPEPCRRRPRILDLHRPVCLPESTVQQHGPWLSTAAARAKMGRLWGGAQRPPGDLHVCRQALAVCQGAPNAGMRLRGAQFASPADAAPEGQLAALPAPPLPVLPSSISTHQGSTAQLRFAQGVQELPLPA